jgi:hypothetical protein
VIAFTSKSSITTLLYDFGRKTKYQLIVPYAGTDSEDGRGNQLPLWLKGSTGYKKSFVFVNNNGKGND